MRHPPLHGSPAPVWFTLPWFIFTVQTYLLFKIHSFIPLFAGESHNQQVLFRAEHCEGPDSYAAS